MEGMTGDEIRALRRALDVTARKLGETLGVDQATVLAWEREELFPTKRHVEAMRALSAARGAKGDASAARSDGEAMKGLADPALWALVRKLLAFEELRADVEALAAKYPDPAAD